MLYADDACIVSRSLQGLTEMMEVIVDVCRTFALTVSAKKTETMCMPSPRTLRTMVRTEVAGQIYKQVHQIVNLLVFPFFHLPRGRRDRIPGYVR